MKRRLIAVTSTKDKTPEQIAAELMAGVAKYEAAKQKDARPEK
jgi:hypothetical protein